MALSRLAVAGVRRGHGVVRSAAAGPYRRSRIDQVTPALDPPSTWLSNAEFSRTGVVNSGYLLPLATTRKSGLHERAPPRGVGKRMVEPGPVRDGRVDGDVLQRGLAGPDLRVRQRLACVRAPVVAHRSLEPMASPGRSPSLVNTNPQFDPPPRRLRRPGGPEWLRPGSTAAPLASSAMTPPPNPVEPAVSSLEALMQRPGRALLATIAAIKVARLLYHGLVEPIARWGQLCWCPGRLLWLLHANLRPRSGSIV